MDRGCDQAAWRCLIALVALSSACTLKPEHFRESLLLQHVEFDGAYVLNLSEGLECLREVKSERGPVKQSLESIADFYEQFYAFRALALDPTAVPQRQAAGFDFGVYGSARGGGGRPEDARVDLVGGLRALAQQLPAGRVSVADWFPQSNSLFARLRDAHVDWRNGGTRVDKVLNQFIFVLEEESGRPVRIEVQSALPTVLDGSGRPKMHSRGKELRSVGGLEPMEWFRRYLLENPAFNYAFKSLGGRANRMLKSARVGLAWLGSHMGDVSSLPGSVTVRFADGEETRWSWKWLLLTRSLHGCRRFDAVCILELLQGPLKRPGSLHQDALKALSQLEEVHSQALMNVAPMDPDEAMLKLLREDKALRGLLQIEEQHIPGTEAHAALQPAAPAAASPRRWLLDPAQSPLGASYGYFQLLRDSSDELFAVVKISRFYLTEEEAGGFQVQSQFVAFWRELVATTRAQGVTRLLVDLSSNPGGFVDLAYLFVRALHPLRQYVEVCNEYDRPVGSLFKAWSKVNTTPLALFLNSSKAASARVKQLTPSRKAQLIKVLHGVTRACIAMDVLSYDDYMLIQSAIDALDMGEMDAYTLQETVQVLTESAVSFGNPFTLFLTAFGPTGRAFDPFQRLKRRGTDRLSAKFRIEDCIAVYTQEFVDALQGVEHVFQEVLFVTDGLCGSSCDTAARTAQLLSAKLRGLGEAAPAVRFAAFGGLGGSAAEAKATLSATAYPGGNVMSSAMGLLYNPIFSVAALGYLAAEWAGLDSMTHEIQAFRELMPQYPYYWEKLPKYPQSEMYQNVLGPEALPAEFYFFPTEHWLNGWYHDVSGMPHEWNETELRRLHLDAAQAFQPPVRGLLALAPHTRWGVPLLLLALAALATRRKALEASDTDSESA